MSTSIEDLRTAAARVLELDRAATAGPWESRAVAFDYDGRPWQHAIVPAGVFSHGGTPGNVDSDLVASYRTTAPTLARAVLALLDVVDPALAQLAILDMENR